ncbi:MAG: hypothetical protein DRQ55_13705 [Planctomycetota bacterium]|nr:MAG: hypothetical protein DRQ55_13705 [Planctomycetota bacterium]
MTSPAQPSAQGHVSGGFRHEFGGVARELRSALSECLAAAGALGLPPQELARRLGLDKMLTWKVSKLVAREDPFTWAQHVPGSAAWRKLGEALRRHGAPPPPCERLAQAAAAFDAMVCRHVGDRATLHAVVSGLTPRAHAGLLLESRRQAFKGNSSSLGVQAETQLATYIVSRNAEHGGLADMLQVGGMVGFRTLRGDVRWPLFQRTQWTGSGQASREAMGQPLDPELLDRDCFPWLAEFSSAPLPSVEVTPSEHGLRYVLSPSSIGLTGAVDCIYGLRVAQVGPVRRSDSERTSEFGVNLLTPVARMQLDLFVERDLEWERLPEYVLVSRIHGGVDGPMDAAVTIPSAETVVDLGSGLAGSASAHLPRYGALMASVFGRAGLEPERFSGCRLSMEVPPIPATALLRHRLAE